MTAIAALAFLALFVIFIYGALSLAFLGLANWLLHSLQHSLHLASNGNIDFKLVAVTAAALVASWVVFNMAISRGVYYALCRYYTKKKAANIAEIVLFAMFHIFAMPVLFWRMFVQNYAPLRRHRRTRLKQRIRASHRRQSASRTSQAGTLERGAKH